MHVHELMTHTPGVCTTTDHLSRAAQVMWDRDCGSVPVLDGAGKLIGIVTDRDVCMAAYTQGRALHDIPVADVMSKVVYTIGPDATYDDALEALQRHAVRRLPVTDADGILLGMLSLADFARAARGGRKSAGESELVAALQSVSRARDGAAGATQVAGTLKNAGLKDTVLVPAAKQAASRKPATKTSSSSKSSSKTASSGKSKRR